MVDFSVHGQGPKVGAVVGVAGSTISSIHALVSPDWITSVMTAIGFGIFGIANVLIIIYQRWMEARRVEFQRTQRIERDEYRQWVEMELDILKRGGNSSIDSNSSGGNPGLPGTVDVVAPDKLDSGGSGDSSLGKPGI